MRLYVEEKKGTKKTGNLIFLNKMAKNRKELERNLGSKEFYINGEKYFVSQVKAMASNDSSTPGAIIGGTLGMLGGIAGVVVGGALGWLAGNSNDKKEEDRIKEFNGSRL